MKKILLIAVLIFAIFVIIFSSLNLYLLYRTDKYILPSSKLEDTPYDCILVLGAGIRANSEPSDMLRDRLLTAIDLYNRGYSDTLLLSGDCSGEDYDEVAVMKNFCIANGVPEENIVCDKKGFSTYESVYNTKASGDYEKIIIVTQRYHLSRAVYISNEMELETFGVSADLNTYRGQLKRDIRESFARIKDIFKSIN